MFDMNYISEQDMNDFYTAYPDAFHFLLEASLNGELAAYLANLEHLNEWQEKRLDELRKWKADFYDE